MMGVAGFERWGMQSDFSYKRLGRKEWLKSNTLFSPEFTPDINIEKESIAFYVIKYTHLICLFSYLCPL